MPEPKRTELTRADMVDVIRRGEAVLLKDGRIITKVDDLPDEAELAAGNAENERLALESLDAQMTALQSQRARLTARAPRAATEPRPAEAGPTEAGPAEEPMGGPGRKGK